MAQVFTGQIPSCQPINSVKAWKETHSIDPNRGKNILWPHPFFIHHPTPRQRATDPTSVPFSDASTISITKLQAIQNHWQDSFSKILQHYTITYFSSYWIHWTFQSKNKKSLLSYSNILFLQTAVTSVVWCCSLAIRPFKNPILQVIAICFQEASHNIE